MVVHGVAVLAAALLAGETPGDGLGLLTDSEPNVGCHDR